MNKIKERNRRKAALTDRKSAASQARMKNIAHLAADERVPKKRRKANGDDMFGADDADWAIYRKIVSRCTCYSLLRPLTRHHIIESRCSVLRRRRRHQQPSSTRGETPRLRSQLHARPHPRLNHFSEVCAGICVQTHLRRRGCRGQDANTPERGAVARMRSVVLAEHGWCRLCGDWRGDSERPGSVLRSRERSTCEGKLLPPTS